MRILSQIFALLVVLAASTSVADAQERPRAIYQWVDSSRADIAEPQAQTSNIIFLNRCQGGCVFSPGNEDSRTNRSGIVNGPSSITEWAHGDENWNRLVSCVQAMYDPFDVVITDVDPGPAVEHFEAVEAGTPGNLGLSSGIGGISPFACGVINNAVNFSFANIYNSVTDICHTVAQESAHSFGLEHEYLCSDPMTYLDGCGKKWFHDETASCGEYSPRSCDCKQQQNSYQELLAHFGPGKDPGPKLDFVRPLDQEQVESAFEIEITGTDYHYGLEGLEVFVNGASVGTGQGLPFVTSAPAGLSGAIEVEVRGIDIRGVQSSRIISVNSAAVCGSEICGEGETCQDGVCTADVDDDGDPNNNCSTDDTCEEDASTGDVIGGCGCQTESGGGSGLLFLAALFVGLARRRHGQA
jgi:MYXO-CTERM domain-containing protein